MLEETITLEGHIIDSDVLRRVFARIVEGGGQFEILDFQVGQTNEEPSTARLSVRSKTAEELDAILEGLSYLGASTRIEDARFAAAEANGILPDDFYSTTNFDTSIRVAGKWLPVAAQKMDAAIVLRDGHAVCVKQRAVKKDEPVALRGGGIRVRPPERERKYSVFGFMSNEVSAEVNKSVAIRGCAHSMRKSREEGSKIVLVTGPAVIHSGGDQALARLVRDGWIDVLLTGNAFAVHDLEKSILKTSLGICQMSGRAVEGGSRNHLFAINTVNRAGGVAKAVETGVVKSGVMYECVRTGTPFVLAGSIRDDGPLLDVITDVRDAQEAYIEALEGAGTCLILASALHGIAVGNLLPARVRTVCVDMLESIPTKLANRGTHQALGLVTDVGFFLESLERELAKHE